jgi:hypothetical protein
MVEKSVTSPAKVIELARFRQGRAAGRATAISARTCRYCNAALLDGENEDECSSTFNVSMSALCARLRRFYAD